MLADPRNAGLTVRVKIESASRVFQKTIALPKGALAGSTVTAELP